MSGVQRGDLCCKIQTTLKQAPGMLWDILWSPHHWGLSSGLFAPCHASPHTSYWLLFPFFFLSLRFLIIPSSHRWSRLFPGRADFFCSLGTHGLRTLPTITGLSQIKAIHSPRGAQVPHNLCKVRHSASYSIGPFPCENAEILWSTLPLFYKMKLPLLYMSILRVYKGHCRK